MIKKLLFSSLVIGPVGTYFYHGFDKAQSILNSKVPAQTFLYIQHVGSYSKIGDTFKIVGKDVKGNADKFQNLKHGAIFYDNPATIKSLDDGRAVAGLFFTGADKAVIENFVKEHPGYSKVDIPELETISAKIPFKSSLSYIWLAKVVIPKMHQFFEKSKLGTVSSQAPLIEFYEMSGDTVQNIEAHIPYGENLKKLVLTNLSEPAKKSGSK